MPFGGFWGSLNMNMISEKVPKTPRYDPDRAPSPTRIKVRNE